MEEKKKPEYVLKLTGKVLSGPTTSRALNAASTARIAREIKAALEQNKKIAIIIGGGNIFRGREVENLIDVGFDQGKADYIGMAATLVNALFFEQILKIEGIVAHTLSTIEFKGAAYYYTPEKAKKNLTNDSIIIVACGIGRAYVNTDFAAVSCARDLNIPVILKGTMVDGLFDKDPKQNKDAKLISEISIRQALVRSKRFEKIIDIKTLGHALDTPSKTIHIFNIFKKDNLLKILSGEEIGSKIVP